MTNKIYINYRKMLLTFVILDTSINLIYSVIINSIFLT